MHPQHYEPSLHGIHKGVLALMHAFATSSERVLSGKLQLHAL